MSRDTLSDLLRAVRLRGAMFFYVEASAPWVAESPHQREIIPSIMPGAEHLMEFHAVVSGSCWGGIVDESAILLEAGDVILFPQGDAHVMSSAAGMRSPTPVTSVYEAECPPQRPYALTVTGPERPPSPDHEASATVVCGFLGLDARPFNPLLASLPRVIRVPGTGLGENSWVTTLLRVVVTESSVRQPGGDAVLERMSEMLFVETLRRHIESLPEEQTGWLAGVRDPAVGRVLSLIHEKPAEAWTLERLGEAAGLSRSSLHERFVHYIAQPPMQYLTQWRMQVASAKLRDTNAKVIEVALDVGYESEAAFSRAFKRVAGASPGAWRKVNRAHSESR